MIGIVDDDVIAQQQIPILLLMDGKMNVVVGDVFLKLLECSHVNDFLVNAGMLGEVNAYRVTTVAARVDGHRFS